MLPGALAGLGLEPAGPSHPGPARLRPAAARWVGVCVLLVDGLGHEQLRAHPTEAPFLTALAGSGDGPVQRRVGFPSTTATSLATFGTGLPPGRHGMVGYEVAVPGTDQVLNSLRWDDGINPRHWQPQPTWFERAEPAGVRVVRIGPGAFAGSGLTEAALRGGQYRAADTPGERVAAVADALRGPGPVLVYAYYGDLDAAGHRAGYASLAWRAQLRHVDLLAEQLAAALPPGAALVVTADHGMLDVPAEGRLDVAAEPELLAGVRLVVGEPRARAVHTVPGAAADVLAAWRGHLGPAATVLSRAEAEAAGWFGPVSEDVRERLGDVVVACGPGLAVVDSRRATLAERSLVGLHGGLTDAEQLVPHLVATGG